MRPYTFDDVKRGFNCIRCVSRFVGLMETYFNVEPSVPVFSGTSQIWMKW